MSDLVTRAAAYAKAAHESIDHRRKYDGQPYFVHPEELALDIQKRGFRDEMVAAAYLHDVVEDTPRTIDEIYADFGDDVGRMVAGLTDISIQDEHKDKSRDERKTLDRKHTASESADVQTIKYADIKANTRDIGFHPKARGFARKKYLPEIKKLLEDANKGDKELYREAWELYYQACEQVNK